METDYDHNNRLPDMNAISLGVVKNRKEGKCEVFRDISTQPERGNYNPDRTNGLYEFYDNKKLKENVAYVNNEKDGWRYESDNDKESRWYSYKNGEKYSELIEFKNGMKEERLVHSGKVISVCSYNGNHEKNGIGYLFNDNHISYEVLFQNGKIRRTRRKFEGKEMSIFDDNGKIVYQGEYLDSIENDYPREGKGKEYKDGEIVYDGHYHLNDREGKGKSYMNGKIEFDGKWKNNKPDMKVLILKRTLLFVFIALLVFMAIGGIIGYFMWKNKIESVSVVTSQIEFDKLSKYTQHISFAKESCNENTFTNLDFSRFSNLRSIEVGDNSLMYVKNVKIDGLSKLEKVNIGQNSFTEYRNGHASNSQDNSFVIKNCDSLESISIDRYSFSDYNSFTIESKIIIRV